MEPESDDPPPPYTQTPQESTPLLPSYKEDEEDEGLQPHRRRARIRRLILIFNLLAWFIVALLLVVGIKHWFYAVPPAPPAPIPTVKVAVIGAGPAGVATAYTIEQELKGKDVKAEIVLFEKRGAVGGRMVLDSHSEIERLGRKLHTEDVAGGNLGKNQVLRDRARVLGFEFGLKESEGGGKEVGLFDGRNIVSKVSRPSGKIGWGAWLGLVWRYGTSVLWARNLPIGTMTTFQQLLSSTKTFKSVSAMVEAAEIGGAVGMDAIERLKLNGIGGRYVDEVLGPQLWRQTGQSVEELSDLAISMALDREEQASRGNEGGFETIMGKFIDRSRVDLKLNTTVTGLKWEMVAQEKEAWILQLQQSEEEDKKTYDMFDQVILAGPWNTNSLLVGQNREGDEVFYRSLWVTFLLSNKKLSREYFGSSNNMPPQILPIPSANLPSELEGIYEISHVADIFGPDINIQNVRMLYRIQSNHSISIEKIHAFREGETLKTFEEKIENAYPLMWPRKGKFGKFQLQEGLWHTGVVEGIGSSVDLSWVAGENVGRLVAREVVKRR